MAFGVHRAATPNVSSTRRADRSRFVSWSDHQPLSLARHRAGVSAIVRSDITDLRYAATGRETSRKSKERKLLCRGVVRKGGNFGEVETEDEHRMRRDAAPAHEFPLRAQETHFWFQREVENLAGFASVESLRHF